MNVLIVENEVYLARSIASRLSSLGYECHLASTIQEALKDKAYDAVLLSTNISGQNFYPVIEKHKNSIVILMISYISNDTVSNPIKAGANDYIQKPFMIEELTRKLNHLMEFDILKNENSTYKNYLDYIFYNIKDFPIDRKIKLPLLIKTNNQKSADSFMFKLSFFLNKSFQIISLADSDIISKLQQLPNQCMPYLVDLQLVKKSEKNKILNVLKNKKFVIVSTDIDEELPMNTINFNTPDDVLNGGDILSLENYVKYIISNYQYIFPDTELAKKLGISRKSLWERRKKYGIIKDK